VRLAALLALASCALTVETLLVGCPANPPPGQPTTFDGSDGATLTWAGSDPASRACAHLQQLGCPVGNDPHCGDVFDLPPQYGVSADCVLNASSKAAAAACRVTCK
jgi:hypothetical protein